MDIRKIKQGDILAKRGGSVENLWLIMDGNVRMQIGRGSVTLGKGDFIGLADVESGVYSCDYIAASEVSVRNFASRDMLYKSDFLSSKPDNCRAIALSINKIAISAFRVLNELDDTLTGLLELTKRAYSTYCEYSVALHSSPREIEAVEFLPEGGSVDFHQKTINRMHLGMNSLLAGKESGQSLAEARIIPGYILHCSADIKELCPAIETVSDAISDCIDILLNESDDDIYGRFCNLYIRATSDNELAAPIRKIMDEIYDKGFELDPRIAEIRQAAAEVRMSRAASGANEGKSTQDSPESADIASRLVDSMNTIMEFGKYPEDKAEILKNAVYAFRKVADPLSTDDEVKRIRKEIEDNFYILYLGVLEQYIKNKKAPVIIKMFLNFGYLDEELCGMDNACELYNIALTYEGNPSRGVYTAAEWMTAVYRKEKEPSINEFDQNYETYLKDQRKNGYLNDDQVKAMLNDRGQKLIFELQNMFRRASRICSGQVLTFCPVFCGTSLVRSIKDDLCDHNRITDAIDRIRAIDFSVFYRETMFVYSEKEGIYDMIHVEVRPDVILLPIIGNRSVMWQEIVGKDRLTPGRFIFPAVSVENLDKLMIKTLGEFRWELCKRIQGARWNDVTDASITSLYCDYLQFYRKNSELSAEQKEKIKTGLQRYKQVYKDYFVNDYSEYIRYESGGSPHLNKTARSILFMQCPFSAMIRQKLAENPIYADVYGKYRIKCGQQIHKLENIAKKLGSHGSEIPGELKREISYYNL